MSQIQGPAEDQEEESELTLTEMKEQREQKKKQEEIEKMIEEAGEEPVKKVDGCGWGFGKHSFSKIHSSHENCFNTRIILQNVELICQR